MPRLLPVALLSLLCAGTTLHAQPAHLDVYVSTGDNHFLGSSLPIDSAASIEATFDLFKNVNRARRVYWRGLEEACWVDTMHARPGNRRYYSLWEWMQTLYTTVKPDELAVKAAHARGMEIWGVGSICDWGSPADTPTFGDYPFPFESKLKLEHPEWAPMDRHGARRQGGPIELAYPEARKALVDMHVKEAVKAGYDGITFLTYVENYSMRFQDEFGYSDPIVADFKAKHRVDLRTEPFKRGASREDWLRLRGSYLTAFLRALRTELNKHHIKLGMIINGNDIHAPLTWNVPELMMTAGSQHMDVDTWVREGLVDSLTVYGNIARNAQMKSIDDLFFLCRQTAVEVSFMSSNPFDAGWKSYHDRKIPAVLAMSDDAQHLARGYVPDQGLEALKGEDVWQRLKALSLAIEGKLKPSAEEVLPLVKSTNMIERRMALQTLGRLEGAAGQPPVVAALEGALQDPENGVRCMAALAIGDSHHAGSWKAVLNAVEQHGNHMLVECAIIALRKMKPLPLAEMVETLQTSKNATARQVGMRTLMPFAGKAQMTAIRAAMLDEDPFTRYAAAEAMGNIRRAPEAVLPLLITLSHVDAALTARVAVSLGVIAARNEPEVAHLRPMILNGLKVALERFGTGCVRADADWGYRPVGNALRAFGEEGIAALEKYRDQREDMRLAELAWRVLDLPQKPNTFSETTEKENDEAYKRRPVEGTKAAAAPAPVRRDLHVDPATGDDKSDGVAKPFKTITRAIRLAQAGDTIHLKPGTYYESADLTMKHGERGNPIVLDGHGAVLDGSEPLVGKDWEEVSPGLFRKQKLIPRMDDAVIGRWFFLWNGKMNHMGRTSKGRSLPLKKPAELQQDEWTYVAAEEAFYLRLPPGQIVDAANIRYPLRSSGVVTSITGSHLVVKNVTCTHVYNDGFNIHGLLRDCRFENIASIDCGDDGFSAHDDCHSEIDGFVSMGNSTGLCDTGTSVTHYKNVFMKDNLGFDIYFISHGQHSMENVLVESSAATAVSVGKDPIKNGVDCQVRLKNVHVRAMPKNERVWGPQLPVPATPHAATIGRNGVLETERCTFVGLNTTALPGAKVVWSRSLMSGGEESTLKITPDAVWQGEGNLYDKTSVLVDQTAFTHENWADFQKVTSGESGSRWEAVTTPPPDTGADEPALKAWRQKVRVAVP